MVWALFFYLSLNHRQGTHMYTLYLSYNVNISALFLTGFLSGAFFAPFLGSAVDRFGRKRSCIAYCLLEIIINCIEHSTSMYHLVEYRRIGCAWLLISLCGSICPGLLSHFADFHLLLLGRVLGGISTNLLFSAFESWMTTEHRKHGFPEEWLSKTYSEVRGTAFRHDFVFPNSTWIFHIKASIGNGVTAILAGITSQVLEDSFGHIGESIISVL